MNNINEAVRGARVEVCSGSVSTFARTYFKKYLYKEMCQFHKDLYSMLMSASRERNERIAIAAPRGSAKSVVVSLVYIIWSICYRKEGYIVILSDTHDQAVAFLSHIKEELENNEELCSDFPEACGMGSVWKEGEIITQNGVKVTALGAGQKIRGRRNKEARPSLIILDDIENDENTQNPDSREKLFNRWFSKAILKAGSSSTNVVVIGTIQHYDSLLAKLTCDNEMPGWKKRIYKSVISWSEDTKRWETWANIFHGREPYKGLPSEEGAKAYFDDNKGAMLEGTKVLWAEKEDYYALMVMKEKEGKWSFDSEKQNEPVSQESCPFNSDGFPYWCNNYKTEEELIQIHGEELDMYGGCDPSMCGGGKSSDYPAIITVARHRKTGVLYILDVDMKRRKPKELIEAILTYCQKRKYKKFVIEANGFQELMAMELARLSAERGIYVPIEPIKNTDNKEQRILWLAPLIDAGIIQFSKKHQMLLDQMRCFPKAKHDDGPDALQMVVRCCQQIKKETVTWLPLTGGGREAEQMLDEYMREHPEVKAELDKEYPNTCDPDRREYGDQYDPYRCDDDDD